VALTRSTAADRASAPRASRVRPGWRTSELLWMAAAMAVAAGGLAMVWQAKARQLADQVLNLNRLESRVLAIFPEPAERQFVARKIYQVSGGLSNVGAIARIRVPADEIRRTRGLADLRARLGPGSDTVPRSRW
jgi:hypothetical protein